MSRIHVSLSLPGFTVQFTGEESFFAQHVEPLLAAATGPTNGQAATDGRPSAPEAEVVWRPPSPLKPPGPPTFVPASPQHFHTFVNQVGDRAGAPEQKVMAFAFYLWNYEKQEEFRREEVERFFRTVHQEPPADLMALVGDLWENRRFLEPGAEEGTWRLTAKGVNYVKNRLLASA